LNPDVLIIDLMMLGSPGWRRCATFVIRPSSAFV
jgi:hypothetical protein